TVAIAALGVLFLEKWLAHRPVRLARPETHLLLAFVAIAGFSAFGALWPRYAAEQGLGLLKMVAVYLLVLNTVDTWRKLRIAMGVTVLAGLFPAIGALEAYPAGGFAQGARAGWLGIFANSNDLAYSLVLLMPLALALLSDARALAKPLWLLAALVYTATLLITFSRGSLLALGVVLVLCLVRWGSASARIIGACVLGACLIFVTSYWTRSDTEGQLLDQATIDLRFATIKTGAAMLADYPLLGVGLGCSVLGWPLYAPPEMTSWNSWLGVHNTAVQVFTETGVLGGGVFLLMLGTALAGAHRASRAWKRARRPDLHRLVSAQEIALYGFLACGLTGGYLLSWFPYLILGLASAARLLPAEAAASSTGGSRRPAHARFWAARVRR
ncbi:MAG TPA: O-antigen ligase family protein, partial [Thermoanaerobaculia bacterium]|nr:O-antigen ligase family protein [Thermoanaerobaculia bacterium]